MTLNTVLKDYVQIQILLSHQFCQYTAQYKHRDDTKLISLRQVSWLYELKRMARLMKRH